MKKLLILAIILRLLVATFYFHPDIKTYNFQASFLRHGVFNIYSYVANHQADLPIKEPPVYLPLTYLVVGGYQAVAAPILGKSFDSWLGNAGVNSFIKDPNIFRYLLVLKLPILAFDVAIAYLLMRFFDDKGDKKKVFTFWLFNPFTVLIFYVFSNVDIYPVALTVLGMLAAKENKLLKASAFFGIAAAFKLYPLLFVPFIFLKAVGWKNRLRTIVVPIAVLLLVSLPYMSGAFIHSALISGLTTRIFNPGITVGFGEYGILGLVGVTMLFFYGWLFDENINLFNYLIALFLIIFSFSHFNIQWLAWIGPFVVILAVKKPKLSLALFVLALFAISIPFLYEDRSMSVGLIRVYSNLFDVLPTPFVALQKFYDPYNLQSILHSMFAGGSLVVVYRLFKT